MRKRVSSKSIYPGPWHVEEENGTYGIFAKESLLAINLADDMNLMAAAPRLLEVIREIKEHLDNNFIVTG